LPQKHTTAYGGVPLRRQRLKGAKIGRNAGYQFTINGNFGQYIFIYFIQAKTPVFLKNGVLFVVYNVSLLHFGSHSRCCGFDLAQPINSVQAVARHEGNSQRRFRGFVFWIL
jgi:hypothetical protein